MTGGSHIHLDKYLGIAWADRPRGRCYSGPKTRGRGCLKGYKAAIKRIKSGSQKLKINFDSLLGGPYGENSRTFVDEIVMFTRKKGPTYRSAILEGCEGHCENSNSRRHAGKSSVLFSQML